MNDRSQRRVDGFIAIFSFLLVLAVAGMVANVPMLLMLTLPLMMATLTFLASLDSAGSMPDRVTTIALTAFHAVSFALWLVAWLALNDDTVVMFGLPLSTGTLVLIGWPLYTFVSGPLYAFCYQRFRKREEHVVS